MRSIYKNGIRIISGRQASLLILIFCIAAKSLLICFYTYTGKDKIYSLSASYNLLHGKGWTNSFYYADDLNKEILEPFCFWPPGYGLLMSPFQLLFGSNIYVSTSVFEIICFIIFILLCRAILKTQGLSTAWLNISTIMLSFYSHDFIENSLGTDLLALDFLLGFIYCCIRTWHAEQFKVATVFGAIGGACLFLAGFTRYLYVPVSLLMGLLVLFFSFWKGNKITTRGYLFTVLVCFAGLIAAMFFQQAACGSPFYTGVSTKGFFPQNLSYWHPSTVASIINLNLVPVQLGKHTTVPYSSWLTGFHWLNILMYLFSITAFCIFFYRNRSSSRSRFPVFIMIGSILSAAIIGGLALLSLTHGVKYTLSGDSWTFIVEGRYHAFPVVFLQLFFLKLVSESKDLFRSRRFSAVVLSGLFILFVLNSVHQFYYTAKVALTYRQMKSASAREQDYVFFETMLKKTIKENPGKDIIVASSDKYYPLLASMHGKKGIADPYVLNDRPLVVDKPAILFTVIFAPENQHYVNYLGRKQATLVKDIAGTRFYTELLYPSQQEK